MFSGKIYWRFFFYYKNDEAMLFLTEPDNF